jgi:hypothetical protein
MENYKLLITKRFVSLIGAKTRLQPIEILRDAGASQTVKVKCKAHNFFKMYTFLDSDFNTLIENVILFNLLKTFVRNRQVNLPV